MLVITPAETFETPEPLEAGPELTPADLAEAKRKAQVAFTLANIVAWERMQSPLAANRF